MIMFVGCFYVIPCGLKNSRPNKQITVRWDCPLHWTPKTPSRVVNSGVKEISAINPSVTLHCCGLTSFFFFTFRLFSARKMHFFNVFLCSSFTLILLSLQTVLHYFAFMAKVVIVNVFHFFFLLKERKWVIKVLLRLSIVLFSSICFSLEAIVYSCFFNIWVVTL